MHIEREEADMTPDQAYELAARWHDKQARHCREISNDEPRIDARIRGKALDAMKHHEASAAGLRHVAVELRRKEIAH